MKYITFLIILYATCVTALDYCDQLEKECWKQCGQPLIFPFRKTCQTGVDSGVSQCYTPPGCVCNIPENLRNTARYGDRPTQCQERTCDGIAWSSLIQGSLDWCEACGDDCNGYQNNCIARSQFCQSNAGCGLLTMCIPWRQEMCRLGKYSGRTCDVTPVPPTAQPTMWPTAEPTLQPTPWPTAEPTLQPTQSPTLQPTPQPTPWPTAQPTQQPTAQPTMWPTEQPTIWPTEQPTPWLTPQPTMWLTAEPTPQPTVWPTPQPTLWLTAQPTMWPTAQPTLWPTPQPIMSPTAAPTVQPTIVPTPEPSVDDYYNVAVAMSILFVLCSILVIAMIIGFIRYRYRHPTLRNLQATEMRPLSKEEEELEYTRTQEMANRLQNKV